MKNVSTQRSNIDVCVSFYDDGLSIAFNKQNKSNRDELQPKADFFPVQGFDEQINLLQTIISQYSLQGLSTLIVIEPGAYQLLQVPTPKVYEKEVDSALRWQIRNLVDYDIENCLVRSFPAPGQENSSSPMSFVIAIEKDKVNTVVSRVNDLGLLVDYVNITELSLADISLSIEGRSSPLVLVSIFQKVTSMVYMAEGKLFRSRLLDYGARDFGALQQVDKKNKCCPDHFSPEFEEFIIFCHRHYSENGKPKILLTATSLNSSAIVFCLNKATDLSVEQFKNGYTDPRILAVLGGLSKNIGANY